LPKSVGYALRSFVARSFGMYRKNVTLYLCLTDFQRQRLTAAGFPKDRIDVLPNVASHPGSPDSRSAAGDYVAFIGRLSPEKGIDALVQAAKMHPDIPFKAAGNYEKMPNLAARTPSNFELVGHLAGDDLEGFFYSARMIVLASTWFEGFPDSLARAMVRGKPVVCSRIGGLPEIVDDGRTGLLCRPGDIVDLAEKIRALWDRPELCRAMGQAGREKAIREYSEQRYYERLMEAYQRAMTLVVS
jgi:glycosyltransferase involved in cell wall biosynthesis